MSINFFKLSFRSIIKQRSQSLINVIGLSIAICCSILILLYVQFELGYDKYHENAARIYRIVQKQPQNMYMGRNVFGVTPSPLKDALTNDIPEVKYSTRCILRSHVLEYNTSLFTEKGFLYADSDFLKIFSFPGIVGSNPIEALKEPFSLLISKVMASKYFGGENPIGKNITVDNKYVYTVKGILRNIPFNSHFTFDFLTSFETYLIIHGGKERVGKWNDNNYITYLELINNVKPDDLKRKLKEIVVKYLPKESRDIQYIAEPLTDIHLSGTINAEPGKNSDVRYLYLISSIGILITLIACFNYMNMVTARSFSMGRKIGILKVAGGSKYELIRQFITETVLLSFLGLVFAMLIVWSVLPLFSKFTDRPLTFNMIFGFSTIIKVVLLTLVTGIFAGAYPAFHLASISPIHLINKDFKNIGRGRKPILIRNVFLTIQYIIAMVALVCVFTIIRQLNFVKNTYPGFIKDNILNVLLSDPIIRKNPNVLIAELKNNSKILDITTSSELPVTIKENSPATLEGESTGSKMTIYRAGVANNFFDFYNIKIVTGRRFSEEYLTDKANSYIINQTTAKLLGWVDPVGKGLGFPRDIGLKPVIGVIKDFNFHSLHLAIEPLSFSAIGSTDFSETDYLSVKVSPGSISETRLFVEKKLKEFSPHYINPVTVLSDQVEEMYSSDRKLVTILIFATVIAFLLTCLGQFSLSFYTTQGRRKEAAIRKILGAQPSEIMVMLIADFAKWICISIFFAWPVAYFLITKWLQNFAYHVEIGVAVFFYSLLISLFISLATISYHVRNLSRINPSVMISKE